MKISLETLSLTGRPYDNWPEDFSVSMDYSYPDRPKIQIIVKLIE